MSSSIARAARRALARTGRSIARALAPFATVDAYGTDQRAYSIRAAAAWLPYCAPGAAFVRSRITGRVLAMRGHDIAPPASSWAPALVYVTPARAAI